MSIQRIEVSAVVDGDIGRVWDLYTNPDHIIHWNFADPSWHCPAAANDMEVGGVYKARMESRDGAEGFDFEAVYTDVQKGKEFTYQFGDRFATVCFEKQGDHTKITVTFDPENENPVEMQSSGWQSILDNFKDYANAKAV